MLKTIVLFGLASLIVLSPLAVGSVYVVTYSAMELIVFALAFIYLYAGRGKSAATHDGQAAPHISFVSENTSAAGLNGSGSRDLSSGEGSQSRAEDQRKGRISLVWVSLPLLLFLAVILIQMIPLPPSFIRLLSPGTHSLYEKLGLVQNLNSASFASYLPFTLSVDRTSIAFLKWCAFACAFLLVALFSPSRAFGRKGMWLTVLVISVFVVGFVEGIYGFYLQSSSPEALLWFTRTLDTGGRLQGTYVNADHFAALMNLSAPLSIGFLTYLIASYRKRRPTLKGMIVDLVASRQGLAMYILFVGIVVMLLALIFSGSRGAQIGLCSGVAVLVLLFSLRGKRHQERRSHSRFLAISIICIGFGLVFASARGLEPVVSRWNDAHADIFQDRLFMWKAAEDIVRDFPLTGTGLGTFELVFPPYRPEELRTSFYDHAHNDYLEVLSEAGVIGFVPWISFFLAYFYFVIRKWFRTGSPYAVYVGAGGTISVIAMSVHSLADFNMQIPANALVLLVVMAITWRAVHTSDKGTARLGEHLR